MIIVFPHGQPLEISVIYVSRTPVAGDEGIIARDWIVLFDVPIRPVPHWSPPGGWPMNGDTTEAESQESDAETEVDGYDSLDDFDLGGHNSLDDFI